jgi:phage repressor protein C with HTH and peptisase S24 domain
MDTQKAARETELPTTVEAREPSAQFLQQAMELRGDELKRARKDARELFRIQVGQRCKSARGAMEIQAVADYLGVHRNTIWNIERGDSLPDAFELELLARLYKTTPTQLLTGDVGEVGAAQAIAKDTRAVQIGDFIYVPHFDVQASAGQGNVFNQVESVIAMRPFDQSYIRGELGITHHEMALITVIGSSMEPLLHSRDTVMVDLRSGTEVFNDGIHVVRLDQALLVKQVQRLPGKSFRIRSLNPDYEPFEIKASEETERDFAIIGRVRWGGVTIK